MDKYLPIFIVGAIIGVFTIAFLIAYIRMKKDKNYKEYERHMSDSQLIKRLLGYGKPYIAQFILVFIIMIISIAYDILSPVLILDDSVSAVDTKTERTILTNLRQTRAGRTTILIAHRISTIEQMDKVLFIDDGTVAAFGPHEELYNTCAEYRKMVDLQRLEEEGGDHNA